MEFLPYKFRREYIEQILEIPTFFPRKNGLCLITIHHALHYIDCGHLGKSLLVYSSGPNQLFVLDLNDNPVDLVDPKNNIGRILMDACRQS